MKKLVLAAISGVALIATFDAMANGDSKPEPKKKHAAKAMKHHSPEAPTHMLGVRVEFPPVIQGKSECCPMYYQEKKECPYVQHGGYYWYPHAQSNMVVGYAPYYGMGYYWYASPMTPHDVYVAKHPVRYVYPHAVDKAKHGKALHPMKKAHKSAPKAKPAK